MRNYCSCFVVQVNYTLKEDAPPDTPSVPPPTVFVYFTDEDQAIGFAEAGQGPGDAGIYDARRTGYDNSQSYLGKRYILYSRYFICVLATLFAGNLSAFPGDEVETSPRSWWSNGK